VTANPAIFAAALSRGDRYGAQLAGLATADMARRLRTTASRDSLHIKIPATREDWPRSPR
jgi:transaldolase